MPVRVVVAVALSVLVLSACGKSSDRSPESTPASATAAPPITTAAPITASYTCDDTSKQLSAAFYNDVQPAKLELTWGTEKATLLQQPSGSGIRYSGEGVEYEEHQGKVHVDFKGQQLSCTPKSR